MADYKNLTLSDGKKITLNEYAMTRFEFKKFYTGEMDDDEATKLFSKITGLSIKYLNNIPWMDWRLIVTMFRKLTTRPLDQDTDDDPNSASESISD